MIRLGSIAAALVLGAGMAQAQQIQIGLSLPQDIAGFDFVNGMYELFKDEVEANTDITVDIVYGGALGSPADRLGQMRRGVIQMSDGADGNYAAIFADIQVLNMPYLFPDEETAWRVLDGPLGSEMAEGIREETGIRVLGWWESGGFKHFSANRPIRTPEDMAGVRMRVMGPLFSIPVEALGGSATPIAFGELYTSLSTGVVDGQENSVAVFNLLRLHEVQDHVSLTGHVYAFGPLGINDAFFESLSAEDQEAVMAAAEKAIAFNRESSRAVEADAIVHAREQGVTVVELSEDEKAALRDVMQPAAIEWLRDNLDTPELIERAFEAVEDART